jgi:hypothetical protein
MKKYLENITMVTKSEQKITADLSGSALCHENAELRKLVEDYHSVISQVVILLLTVMPLRRCLPSIIPYSLRHYV